MMNTILTNNKIVRNDKSINKVSKCYLEYTQKSSV